MAPPAVPVAVLSIEGTNNDEELAVALRSVGAAPEVVHLKQFEGREVTARDRRRLADYSMLLFPGGFAAGDYVRAGAILAARVRAAIGPELQDFVRSGHLVGGICNGFQTLTELGLLPGRPDGRIGPPQAALLTNDSGHYECRPTYLRWDGGNFAPFARVPPGTTFLAPSGHAEGKLFVRGDRGAGLDELRRNGQMLFRWVDPEGRLAGYPWNPNGSPENLAGLTNREGNVFGLMPHPERACFSDLAPDWTRRRGRPRAGGEGQRFFAEIVRHARRNL
ncbi:MAG: phosphoribosylformylglycinamidine synthase I [Thermoplasmata archaeon]